MQDDKREWVRQFSTSHSFHSCCNCHFSWKLLFNLLEFSLREEKRLNLHWQRYVYVYVCICSLVYRYICLHIPGGIMIRLVSNMYIMKCRSSSQLGWSMTKGTEQAGSYSRIIVAYEDFCEVWKIHISEARSPR